MKILVTFVGSQDPGTAGAVVGQFHNGPILTLVQHVSFDRIFLLSTNDMQERSAETKRHLKETMDVESEIVKAPIADVTSHVQILAFLRRALRTIMDAFPEAQFYAAVASGTPQMHAVWLLLAASGEFPAHLLQVRRPRYVTAEQPPVCDLDLHDPAFPKVIPDLLAQIAETPDHPDARRAREELNIIGEHPAFQKVLDKAALLARHGGAVLIHGESGTGKEGLARFIHHLSGRKSFMPINCASLESLVDSQLFGHEKGAFTGADQQWKGLFREADGGTVFLDEIGEMPLASQAKLLRFIEDGIVRPIGSSSEYKVDVRIIAATNVDLRKAMREKKFRGDLFHRLNALPLHLPPLRERRSDIPKLTQHFLLEKHNRMPPVRITTEAIQRLMRHPWKGNIRELFNTLERAALYSRTGEITPDDVELENSEEGEELSPLAEPHPGFSLKQYLQDIDARLKERALQISEGNQSEAARLLGITPAAMNKYLKAKSGITKPKR